MLSLDIAQQLTSAINYVVPVLMVLRSKIVAAYVNFINGMCMAFHRGRFIYNLIIRYCTYLLLKDIPDGKECVH